MPSPFQAELDDVRQELRRSGAGAVVLWPKVLGDNVVATAATFTVHRPTGEQLAAGNGTITVFDVDQASRIACAVSAAALDVGENYRVDVTYQVGADTHVESVQFDVLVEPMGTLGLSLNDLVDELADAATILERLAVQQGDTETDVRFAARILLKAWGDVRRWLRKKILEDGESWPLYLLNREDLRDVIVARALHRMFVHQGRGTTSAAESADYWDEQSQRRFAALPPLQFSRDADKVPDATVRPAGSIIRRRRW